MAPLMRSPCLPALLTLGAQPVHAGEFLRQLGAGIREGSPSLRRMDGDALASAVPLDERNLYGNASGYIECEVSGFYHCPMRNQTAAPLIDGIAVQYVAEETAFFCDIFGSSR